MAEDDCNVLQIMAKLGHKTVTQAQWYTKAADQAKLAREAAAKRRHAPEQTKNERDGGKPFERFAKNGG